MWGQHTSPAGTQAPWLPRGEPLSHLWGMWESRRLLRKKANSKPKDSFWVKYEFRGKKKRMCNYISYWRNFHLPRNLEILAKHFPSHSIQETEHQGIQLQLILEFHHLILSQRWDLGMKSKSVRTWKTVTFAWVTEVQIGKCREVTTDSTDVSQWLPTTHRQK